MTEHNRTSRPVAVPAGPVLRMGRIGALAAGVAGRMAVDQIRQRARGSRPAARDSLLTPTNMLRIADELARMRGAAMKIGQLLSMDTGDVLPPELAQIMARLRADADFMPPKQLRIVLDAEWGKGWYRRFARFDVRPIAAASIGQVHRARLPDGTDLAIKVQYSGVARSIDSDVSNIGRLIRLSGLLPEGFALDLYLDEARAQLREEANYCAEAAHLESFGRLLQNEHDFGLPRLHAPLTTRKVLAMTFVESDPIESVGDAGREVRDGVMRRLAELMLRELFVFGLMQTDPNFANYRYDPATGRVVLLDFGATRRVQPALAEPLRALIWAGLANDRESVRQIAANIGLLPTTVQEPFRSRVLDMIALVFDEIRGNGVVDFGTSDLARRLQRDGEALAADGFVPPPMPIDLLYVQRKVAGMFLLARRLRARLAVSDLLSPYLQ